MPIDPDANIDDPDDQDDYDPDDDLEDGDDPDDDEPELEHRVLETEQRAVMTDRRIATLIHWREKRKRYAELRGFRTRAIHALVALDKLTLEEIGQAFGISRQRVEQITRTTHAD